MFLTLFIKLKNLKIHYTATGTGKPLILLPGWGRDFSYFAKIIEHLSGKYKIYAMDLPGFGLSPPPHEVWDSSNYSRLVINFITELKIDRPIIIGHSFGGKVASGVVASDEVAVDKLILIASSGIKLPSSFGTICRIYFFKLVKFCVDLPIIRSVFGAKLEAYKKRFGSNDYKNASGIMRSILVKTLSEDVRHVLPKIEVPTLLVWGDQDKETPLKAGYIMQQNITGSHLAIITGSGHFPFLDNWDKFRTEVDNFLG